MTNYLLAFPLFFLVCVDFVLFSRCRTSELIKFLNVPLGFMMNLNTLVIFISRRFNWSMQLVVI